MHIAHHRFSFIRIGKGKTTAVKGLKLLNFKPNLGWNDNEMHVIVAKEFECQNSEALFTFGSFTLLHVLVDKGKFGIMG